MIDLKFRSIMPFSQLTNNIEKGIFSGIYVWGFRVSPVNKFLPYYVGIADKLSIYERLIHHYTFLDTTYKIFNSKHLKDYYKYLDNSAEPKVKDKTILIYENKKDKKLSKDDPLALSHIAFYRKHFHYTYAPISFDDNQRNKLEFLETYVKYSLQNQTVSKSLSLGNNAYNKRKLEKIQLHSKEIIFKKNPLKFVL